MAKGLFDLSGKVAVITGGNSGLGLGFARGIARQGGDVVIWARNAERNAAARQELEALGVRVATRQVDVSSEQQIVDAYAEVIKTFGRVDTVIANAGPPPASQSSLTLSTDDYHKFLDVALHGAFYTLREGARAMVKRAEAGEPGGSLIACGSLSMFKGLAGKPHYAGSKAAVGAIIRGMAAEFGKHGIRANVVAPGYIKTGMTGTADELSALDKYMLVKNAIPRPGYMSDFEGIAAFLASDSSSFITGETITVDGGAMVMM
ncbi:SDR family NAD(P)-dependent oxidoreductase [Solimonas terrae]|uniref:SDR family oxidoreductase n=1 Tax=Solimonas terrae TaxID=1396819 RepID=A0A6M2BPE5_9GAMM|nr:SDR family oxidoreductase [Solimonas terrae]NGY03949.1 SDR family oxidoreductase [Solimonas terrae]